ncbi:hypothetical protein ACH5RR_021084 [Cinchona calisaya]|uniref:Uncharacterized protein n=1 Tax=Cinchona calisaya TaxID=153742 RepID=A0ABD2ZGA5_9GENT
MTCWNPLQLNGVIILDPNIEASLRKRKVVVDHPSELLFSSCFYAQLLSSSTRLELQKQLCSFHDMLTLQESRDAENDSPAEVIERLGSTSTNDASLTNWHSGFHIFLDMLPEHISMCVAESILFVGKAVKSSTKSKPCHYIQGGTSQQMPKGSQRPQVSTSRASFTKDSSSQNEPVGQELLPQSDANKIETMLQILKESSYFHKRSFETAIDSIRAIAASHLW